jgi:phosphoserine phosphatase RsbU/P
MSSDAMKSRLQLVNFKLNALLEITMAINENLSTGELLNRYEKILKENLNIGKVLIFKLEEREWKCILNSGFKANIQERINVEKDLLHLTEITFITSSPIGSIDSFDIVIPVTNKNIPIAFVLIGDIDEEAEGLSPTIKHLHFIQTLSNVIMVAIENIRLFNESLKQEALKKELELASKMQNMLVPHVESLPRNEHVFVYSFYHPHLEVGGDYYDYIPLTDDEFGFCIADVSGKGISAALLMSNFQANLRALYTHEISLSLLVEKLNERVLVSAKGEKFITLFIAKYNYRTKELEYINAGHNPPLLYQVQKKTLSFLNSGCVGIGMLDEIPSINKGMVRITERSKLLCYTDGLVELINENAVEYGTQAIEESLSNIHDIDKNIKTIIEKQNILNGSANIFDDITMLGIEFFV